MEATHHEEIYRKEGFDRMRQAKILVCGAGAIGGNLIENLARSGFVNLCVVDMDRVEQVNLSTQPYVKDDIGTKKARAIANRLYKAANVKCIVNDVELNEFNASKLVHGYDLVIDTFDNSASRALVQEACLSNDKQLCLHVGMDGGYSEMIWDPGYKVPGPGKDDVCDYPLARNMAVITSAIAAEMITIQVINGGEPSSRCFTLRDMKVSNY